MPPRRLRRKGCTRKVRHASKGAAWAHAKAVKVHGKPYRCAFCAGWHIGGVKGSRLERAFARAKAIEDRGAKPGTSEALVSKT